MYIENIQEKLTGRGKKNATSIACIQFAMHHLALQGPHS